MAEAKVLAADLARLGPERFAARGAAEAALPNWWGECLQEWRTSQQLLTAAGIPVGRGAQAGSNLDSRIASHVVPALARLRRIAEAHHKHVDGHGGTDGMCDECGWRWPCPTYTWAAEDRDASLACWDPRDDEETADV